MYQNTGKREAHGDTDCLKDLRHKGLGFADVDKAVQGGGLQELSNRAYHTCSTTFLVHKVNWQLFTNSVFNIRRKYHKLH